MATDCNPVKSRFDSCPAHSADGNREKKIVRKATGNHHVTVYIDVGFEYIYTLDGTNTVDYEYNEIHVMDGRSRVARIKVEDAIADGAIFLLTLKDRRLGAAAVVLWIGYQGGVELWEKAGKNAELKEIQKRREQGELILPSSGRQLKISQGN